MTKKRESSETMPIFISRSHISTEINKTGSWRFVRPRYEDKTAPCSAACPAGEDIGRIEILAAKGLYKEAAETILRENPLPAVCGRVCFHPCESACNRQEFDEAVAIHCLERFLGDVAFLEEDRLCIDRFPSKGKRVAIIGSGPAGLAAGWFMTRLGFECDLFEAKSKPGGLLRWGIPRYRLPEDILEKEIKRIENQGVTIHCETPVTNDFIEEAKGRYDAIYIGCGLGRSIRMRIPGEEAANDGLELLCRIRQEGAAPFSGTAAVIGGGNTAVDVARSLLRAGASPVLVYRRRKQDMPAFMYELEMALEEGVELMELVAPIRIEAGNGEHILTLQRMKVSEIEMSGRARVIPDGNETLTLHVREIFTAIGAEAEQPWQVSMNGNDDILKLSHCSIVSDDIPVVYGGDLTNSVKSVAAAVASGKQAAMALDTFFQQGRDAIEKKLNSCRVGNGHSLSREIYTGGGRRERNPHIVSYEEINTDYFDPYPRVTSPVLSPGERITSFAEIENTLSEEQAAQESKRCFNCGVCNECDNCRIFCPEVAVICEDNRYINLEYCKGCGICVVECPSNAMALEEENR